MKPDKVILVNPGIFFQQPLRYGMYPNTAIMVLATILRDSGFRVKVIDGKYYKIDEVIEAIISEIDDTSLFVGFSVMTIQLPWAYYVSRAIKARFPKTVVVWGGVHPTLFPEQTVSDPAVDIVVANDAASTIGSLGLALADSGKLSAVPGLFYKNGSRISFTGQNNKKDNFVNIPLIDFSLIDHKRYCRNNNIAIEEFYANKYRNCTVYPVLTGLGCCYRCAFCINVILEKKYYYREAGEIIERIKFLKHDYGADFIHTLDEDFFISKKRTFEFLDLLEKENLRIKWRPQARVDYFCDNYINIEVARRLERSGMIVAAMGVESASQWVLDKLKKNIKVEQIIKAAEILARTNIVPKMNFMVGLPGEKEADIQSTYNLAIRLRKIAKQSCVSVVPFKPYPGSELYNEIVEKYGYQPPASLREWARISEAELVESVGYESFKNYKWIHNPEKLGVKMYVYNQIAWYNPKIYARIRAAISYIRLRINFFGLVQLEKSFFEKLQRLKRSWT